MRCLYLTAKMKYWTSVIKNIVIFLLTLILIFILFKLAIFYIPFLIGFIISLLIEPIIKRISNKTELTRKTCAIIVLVVIFTIVIGMIVWGVITLITESSNFLDSINTYIDKIYSFIEKYIIYFKIKEINLPSNVTNIIQDITSNILNSGTKYITAILSNTIQKITIIPIVSIYIIITILSTYFICTDRFYILDQVEHHVPRLWVKRFGKHVKEISSILGNYLKAESILVLISFFIILIGLLIGKIVGLKIEYPLLSALLIGFVDALPILRFGNYYYSLGNYFYS